MRRSVLATMSGVSLVVVGLSLRASGPAPSQAAMPGTAPVGIVTAPVAPTTATTAPPRPGAPATARLSPAAVVPVGTSPAAGAPRTAATTRATPATRAGTTSRSGTGTGSGRTTGGNTGGTTGGTSAPSPAGAPTPSPTPSPTPAPTTTTVNGQSVGTQYGPVQVQLSIRSHQIIKADAIAYPSGNRTSVQINGTAIPKLDNETLMAQSAQIDTVSGATYTSNAYKQSLQSAIDAAHAAGIL